MYRRKKPLSNQEKEEFIPVISTDSLNKIEEEFD
jgi:hypothetical protein